MCVVVCLVFVGIFVPAPLLLYFFSFWEVENLHNAFSFVFLKINLASAHTLGPRPCCRASLKSPERDVSRYLSFL